MDWIQEAWEKNTWQAVMNMLMNIWLPQNVGHIKSG